MVDERGVHGGFHGGGAWIYGGEMRERGESKSWPLLKHLKSSDDAGVCFPFVLITKHLL